jgi:hypothetical protein
MDYGPERSWRELLATFAIVFVVTAIGCTAVFALWRQELHPPRVVVLGSGDRLSLLVSEGPARLVLATGDDPIGFENALTRVLPLFARRVDLLLIAGSGRSLLAPVTAAGDPHVRTMAALAPLPPSPESDAIGPIVPIAPPQRIQLGPTVSVTVETALPFAADPGESFPAWRATIERGQTRVIALSDGDAAALFPPAEPASVLIVSGPDPIEAWDSTPAVGLVANSEEINGPALRAAFSETSHPPEWGFVVFPNEALALELVPGGIELPSEPAHTLDPHSNAS